MLQYHCIILISYSGSYTPCIGSTVWYTNMSRYTCMCVSLKHCLFKFWIDNVSKCNSSNALNFPICTGSMSSGHVLKHMKICINLMSNYSSKFKICQILFCNFPHKILQHQNAWIHLIQCQKLFFFCLKKI